MEETSMQFADKKVLVVGGSGSVGSALTGALLERGATVYAVARSRRGLKRLAELHQRSPHAGRLRTVARVDVRDPFSMSGLIELLEEANVRLWSMIYTVGLCRKGQFISQISTPLSKRETERWVEDIHTYATGFLHTCQAFLPLCEDHGHIVALSSAITRLDDKSCPPWLHAWGYIASKAALDKLITGFRHDPVVRKRNIRVHRIAPGALNTPFHEGTPPERRPPALLSVSAVVDEVLAALSGETVVDTVLLPSPAA